MFSCCLLEKQWLPITVVLSDPPHGLTRLLLGTVGLTVHVSACSVYCLPLCPCLTLFSPVSFFLPVAAVVSLSHPPTNPPSSPALPTRFLAGLASPCVPAACGVNCHKACRSRLAVECRKRTKSISHETPPALQARSYSFPPPANTPPSLQSTGEKP